MSARHGIFRPRVRTLDLSYPSPIATFGAPDSHVCACLPRGAIVTVSPNCGALMNLCRGVLPRPGGPTGGNRLRRVRFIWATRCDKCKLQDLPVVSCDAKEPTLSQHMKPTGSIRTSSSC